MIQSKSKIHFNSEEEAREELATLQTKRAAIEAELIKYGRLPNPTREEALFLREKRGPLKTQLNFVVQRVRAVKLWLHTRSQKDNIQRKDLKKQIAVSHGLLRKALKVIAAQKDVEHIELLSEITEVLIDSKE